MTDPIQTILAERGKRYGKFIDQSVISQAIKSSIFSHDQIFKPDQHEALVMIAHKIARIVNGDPNYADSWRDIAGYATLVADRLEGKVQ